MVDIPWSRADMGKSDDDGEVCKVYESLNIWTLLGLLIDVVAYDVVKREDGRLGYRERVQSEQKTCACIWAEGSG